MSIQASLIITTYEMPEHLKLVCANLKRQSCPEFEVIFCDDGSGPSTAEVISEFSQQTTLAVQRVWQEHHGFRKCKILNQALLKARGKTLIFLDGDCVPHRRFVEDHLMLQEEGVYLAGRRVEIGPELSSRISPSWVEEGYFDWPHPSLVWSMWRGDSEFLNRSIRFGSPRLRSWLGMNRIDDLKGCNYSVPRKVMEALNGFDESYEGYGREDTDVELRLQNYGLKIKSLKGLALQFHIWHPRREFTPANEELLAEVRRTGRIQALQGLNELQFRMKEKPEL